MNAALRMFADKSFDGASVVALNRQLGVSHNLIHQWFGSKERLWYAGVDLAFAGIAAALVFKLDDSTAGPLQRFRRIVRRFVHVHVRRPEILRLVTVEGVADSPRLDYLYEHHVEPLLTTLTGLFRQMMDDGVLAPVSVRTLHFLIAHGATAPVTAAAEGSGVRVDLVSSVCAGVHTVRVQPADPAAARAFITAIQRGDHRAEWHGDTASPRSTAASTAGARRPPRWPCCATSSTSSIPTTAATRADSRPGSEPKEPT